ncbi:hypothetical protein BKA57DRAFT_478171 [Linnemannia elongata]|nr:hypothetical protein BKA57DRAFT_479749 [Linnemannia elongata]KAH7031709.1 hypothetical protein BKA57DRAFT_478171 [Linnemannia elongata]
MWKRSIRHTRLLTRARTTRIVPCCHQYQELAWSSPPVETRTTSLRHAWNWAKIKPDPKNPFFAKRSTKNTPHTAVVLLRNAEVPMLQIQPPVFMPSTSEEVQHSLNILLFMSDFNNEPRPLAVNILACSSTGLIHYIQIANQHLSLILPTYNITNGGRQPELIPPLLKTFLESSAYTKIGFGGYEDSARIKDQYGITIKNILDIHWMAKIMGIGSSSVGMLHDVFGEVHDVYIPGRIHPDGNHSSQADRQQGEQGRSQQHLQQSSQEQGAIIDPRRWDWESHGDLELSRELVRCVAQDAFATLKMYDNIVNQKFKPGYQPGPIDSRITTDRARDFLLTSVPRGTLLPVRSLHHLLKGPFMSPEINVVQRDALALALMRQLIDSRELVADRADPSPLSFQDPSILGRKVLLPGVRSSEAILSQQQSRKVIAEAFGCRPDELRLMQDSDMARKPDKIQDLECFLGVYEWLEFLPGAELDEPSPSTSRDQVQKRVGAQDNTSATPTSSRKLQTLLALFLNFGTVARRANDRPVETKQWVAQRIERLVQQGALLRSAGSDGWIRINPSLLRRLKRIDNKPSSIN